uniref:Uncharacterized protein n=1 Tax=Vitis vinifera TaxID=29760 RepID=A5B577_VITVI|nr:hypothetical protein VITISV_015465 [Vitis vinifera]
MVSYIREDLRLSRKCGPLSRANDPDRMFPDTSKLVRAVMKEVTRGVVRTMPCGQTRGSIRGRTHGIKLP